MENRKSALLLTVVAVATLLVAVVGATFAFFASSQTTTGRVNVQAQTAAGADSFTATGSGSLALTVNNNVMMQSQANNDRAAVSVEDNHLTVTLKAGSGKASCSYSLKYTADTTNGAATYTRTPEVTKEYTIAGAAKDASNTAISGVSFAEKNIDEADILGTFNIENTANAGATQTATTHKWNLTAKFYNATKNQDALMNKTFKGTVTVTDVSCTNTAS